MMYHPRLTGSHFDIGKHYGSILYETGEDLSEVINLTNEQKEFGKLCLPIYEKYLPEIMEEVKGLAAGLHQAYEDVAYWLMNIYCNEDDYGCTVFVVKSNDKVFCGRNMDMFPEYKKTSESVLYRIKDKNIFLGHSTAMISMDDGINEYGLCAALTFLLSKQVKPGINGGFIIRKVLEDCKTVEEAVGLINSLPIASTHNFVLADKTGKMAVVECNCDKTVVRSDEQFVIATNHFITKKMQEYNNKDFNWYLTNDRYKTISDYLQANIIHDIDEVKSLISGKYGFVCQFPTSLNFTTIWSVVYELTEKEIEICEGNPSLTHFKKDTRLAWGIKKSRS